MGSMMRRLRKCDKGPGGVQRMPEIRKRKLMREIKEAKEMQRRARVKEKLDALRAAVDEGDASPVAEGYSLERVLAKIAEGGE